MKLYLVRHGIASSEGNQPLTPEGIKETEAIADFLRKSSPEIDEIIHSPKLRAKETANILAKTLAPDAALIEREGTSPNDIIEPILLEIETMRYNLMIVSHLPFLEILLCKLLKIGTCPVNICNSCVICLEGSGKSWQLEWILSPKLMLL